MDLTGYLDRLGVTAGASLPDLHRAHLTAAPFENLDIHLGVPVSLSGADLFDKIVRRRRGGFCYELNGLFALLLEELGHTVTRVAARVYGAEHPGPPFDHLALVVTEPGAGPDGERWLADVGFGDHSAHPLRFGSRSDQDDPHGRFRLADTADGDVQVLRDGKPQYLIERRPRELADFAATCWYQQTSPDSHFTRKTVCTRLTGGGRVTISDRTLIVTSGSGRVETALSGDAALHAAYREHFGIDLGPGAVFRRPERAGSTA